MDLGAFALHVQRKNYPVSTFRSLSDNDIIDLGGIALRCYGLPGHTNGSAVFVDEAHRFVFCGDAFGSGSGVWMFLPDSTSIHKYLIALKNALEFLTPFKDYRFFGGHNKNKVSDMESPLCYETVTDMYELCNDLLRNHKQSVNIKRLPIFPLIYVQKGKAAMVVTKMKIRN